MQFSARECTGQQEGPGLPEILFVLKSKEEGNRIPEKKYFVVTCINSSKKFQKRFSCFKFFLTHALIGIKLEREQADWFAIVKTYDKPERELQIFVECVSEIPLVIKRFLGRKNIPKNTRVLFVANRFKCQ